MGSAGPWFAVALIGAALWGGPAGPRAAAGAPNEAQDAEEGVNDHVRELRSAVDALERFRFSGYVQGRFEVAEQSSDTVEVAGDPPEIDPSNRERFFIRRARLKLTYEAGPLSQAVVYFDGGQDRAILLLEAYVTLRDPWTEGHRHALTVGQMNVPFGWEVERSSGTRELPERSRAENVLFPGERDRGVKIVSRWNERLETVVGLFNGGGIKDPDFPTTDPTRAKDVVARARWSQKPLAVAASWYAGRAVTPLTGPDAETDRTRFGVDAQWTYTARRAGKGMLVGELYRGENLNPARVKALVEVVPTATPGEDARQLVAGADPGQLATDFAGGYVMWVQHLGERLQAAGRWERFDPDLDADHDDYERWSLGLNWFHDRYTRVTVAYDVPRTDGSAGSGYEDPHDNLWTFQVQHKF